MAKTALTLRAFRAKEGDCLILEGGGARILIDGGPRGVYERFLRPALNGLKKGETVPAFDLMMVSHIDDDHIAGILDLMRTLREQADDKAEPLVRIADAWHNSFSDIVAGAVPAGKTAEAQAADVSDALENLLQDQALEDGAKLVIASVKQGRDLRLDLKRLGIRVNRHFADGFALQGEQNPAAAEFGKMSIAVIGPTRAELENLKKKWAEELPAILAKAGGAAEVAAAAAAAERLDDSVHNLASIVCIAQVGKKRILLTGDARGDLILAWLEATGHIDSTGKAHFDILKLPHHGSDFNVNADFFKRVSADHYVVSGDGKYGNPEPATLRMLFEAQPDAKYTLYMTYSQAELAKHPKYKHNVAKLTKVLKEKPPSVAIVTPSAGMDEVVVVV